MARNVNAPKMLWRRNPWQTEKYQPTPWRTRSEIQRILQTIKSHYELNVWPKWITWYKNYLLYKQDRQQKILDFQTNIKLPIVKMFVDTMWTSVYDNTLDLKVSGRNPDDQKNADAMLNYTQWWFAVSNSRRHLMQTIKEAMILWNGYGKIWFIDNTTTIQYNKWTKKVSKEIKEQYPYIKYVSAFNVFHDPTVEYMEDSRYIIERKIMHQKDIIEQYRVFVPEIEKLCLAPKESAYYFFQYDFNRIKYLAFWNREPIKAFMQFGTIENDYTIFWKNYLTVDFKKEYHEVIEYWEDNVFILILDWTPIYDWDNPLPIKKKPYFDIHYNKIPWIPFGQWMATSLEDIQETADTIFNLTIDNIKLQVAPMFSKMKWWDLFQFGEWKLEYTPFGVVEVNTPDWLQRLQLWTPDFSWTNMMQFLMQLWEMSEWVNSYAVWYQNKVERSATWVSALVQAYKSRLLPLTESLNMALSKIAEMWWIIWVTILPETIQVRIQTEEWKTKFAEITMEDILGKFDIEFDAQSLKSATRETRRAQSMQLLQIATTAWIDMATQQYFIDMRKLWKYTLDSFELPAEDFVLNDKQIIKKQFDVQNYRQDFQKKQYDKQWWWDNGWQWWFGWWPQQYNQPYKPTAEEATWWIVPVPWEWATSPVNDKIKFASPESQVLKEAMQQ